MSPEMLGAVIVSILLIGFLLGFFVVIGFICYDYFFSAKKQKALARLLNARAQQVEASNSTVQR